MKNLSYALLTLSLAVVGARAGDDSPADPTLARDTARSVGETVRQDAKVVADAAKDGAQKVAEAAKQVAHAVAESSKEGAHEVAATAKKGAQKTKAAVSGDKPADPPPSSGKPAAP
jgi:hypothetical protein